MCIRVGRIASPFADSGCREKMGLHLRRDGGYGGATIGMQIAEVREGRFGLNLVRSGNARAATRSGPKEYLVQDRTAPADSSVAGQLVRGQRSRMVVGGRCGEVAPPLWFHGGDEGGPSTGHTPPSHER